MLHLPTYVRMYVCVYLLTYIKYAAILLCLCTYTVQCAYISVMSLVHTTLDLPAVW